MKFLKFLRLSVKVFFRGGRYFYFWIGFLTLLMIWGASGYIHQFNNGLIETNMRDSVSWGFYIGNFTFLVGVAAASVMLVIPAYLYEWKPIKEVVIFGEILAVSSVLMCLLFIAVDMGRPLRFWHMLPVLGTMNFPSSILTWDFFVLNSYLLLNFFVVTYLLYNAFLKKEYNKSIVMPLIFISIPLAVGIHTVTAFLYNGMPARHFWNSAILAPKFLTSAFCSGPAVMLILFQILRKITNFKIKDEVIWKIAELMAYAMFINLFLIGSEIFKEYYSDTEQLIYHHYLFSGIGKQKDLVVYSWSSLIFGIIAFCLFLIPKTRKNFFTLNIGAVLIYISVYIEKGIGLIIPAFTPDVLGQFYIYTPSWTEVRVAAGIFSAGFLLFTFMVKVAIAIIFEGFDIDTYEKLKSKDIFRGIKGYHKEPS